MNKKRIFTLIVSLIMVGCAAQKGPKPQTCVVQYIPGMCSNAPHITINTNSHNAEPRNYCAYPGEDIEIKVVPANGDPKSVRTEPKDPANTWLSGINDPDPNGFTLRAPDDSGAYYFYVYFADGSCIDPRISI